VLHIVLTAQPAFVDMHLADAIVLISFWLQLGWANAPLVTDTFSCNTWCVCVCVIWRVNVNVASRPK